MARKKKTLENSNVTEIKEESAEVVSKPEVKEEKADPYKGVPSKYHKFIKKGN